MTTDTPTDAELLAEIRRVCTDFADSHQVSGVLLRLLDARDVRIAELEQELYTMTNTARHHLDDGLAMEAERDRLAATVREDGPEKDRLRAGWVLAEKERDRLAVRVDELEKCRSAAYKSYTRVTHERDEVIAERDRLAAALSEERTAYLKRKGQLIAECGRLAAALAQAEAARRDARRALEQIVRECGALNKGPVAVMIASAALQAAAPEGAA